MILSKFVVCDNKTLRFFKVQEPSGILSKSGIKIPLSKILLFDSILLWRYKVNEIINKFLLAGDKYT